jgi:osmotically-inducible protein OsmY
MRTRVLALAMLLALLAPGIALAQFGDAELGSRVARCVQTYPRFTIFDDVSATVANLNVTLTGWVTDPIKREELGRQVARLPGVRTLTNLIVVLPPSPADVELRQRLARAIYGNSMFFRYGSMSSPPIHIIVANGNVRLTGSVTGENERRFAFALSHVAGARSITNDLRIGR